MVRGARALALVVVLAAPLTSGRALAQETPPQPADSAAEARQQYQMGTQAFQQKRYSEAALHFEAAAAFRASGVALYTAGLAWDLASRPERAADAYARALDTPGLDAKQTGLAKDRVGQLERTLGTLAVSAPEGWKVQLDTFTEVPAPARLHGSPGVHALSVRAPGKPIERRDVSLEAGKVTPLDLSKDEVKIPTKPTRDVEPPPPPPPPPPQQPREVVKESFWTIRRVAGVGVAGLGVAALGGGVLLGISANGAKDAYNEAPTQKSFDHASSLQTLTNVMLIAGTVVTIGGVVLIVLPEKDSPEGHVRVGATPGGAFVAGSF
jgi:hypothetical protein